MFDAKAFSGRMENLANVLEGIYVCIETKKGKKSCQDCPFQSALSKEFNMCVAISYVANYIVHKKSQG